MTGRSAGRCAGFATPGYANRGYGWGQGAWGRSGGGRGWRHWFLATGLPGWMRVGQFVASHLQSGPALEKQALQRQAQDLQSELDIVKKRLDEIEASRDPDTPTG